ncbi:LOW QUALITY PROTEIN: hypothetical protein HID58_081796, partial [Brassica napus]
RWWESSASLERWRGRGEPDLSWRHRIADLSRKVRQSGFASPSPFWSVAVSTVFPCLLLRPLWSFCSSVPQASERSWPLSFASLGVLMPESFVLCSCGGTRVQPIKPLLPPASIPPVLHLLNSQSKAWQLLEIAISGVDFTACDGRTRTCRPCFAYPSSPSGRSAVPRTVLRLRFSIDPSDFDAGSGFKIFTLVYCSTALSCRRSVLDSLGLDSWKPIVSHCLII